MAKAFERIEKFNQDRGGKFAAMKHFGNGDFIACSDALCHHVHGNIPWAGDIEFMDMTSSRSSRQQIDAAAHDNFSSRWTASRVLFPLQ